jgi:hypothetical protein
MPVFCAGVPAFTAGSAPHAAKPKANNAGKIMRCISRLLGTDYIGAGAMEEGRVLDNLQFVIALAGIHFDAI